MGLNLSFFRFVKHVMRDTLNMTYIENFLSFSILFNTKRYSSSMVGGKFR
jgi:hypothetical protein